MHSSLGNEPVYANALGRMAGGRHDIHLVVDTSDGDAVVGRFRNVNLANNCAATSPSYVVRSYTIGGN